MSNWASMQAKGLEKKAGGGGRPKISGGGGSKGASVGGGKRTDRGGLSAPPPAKRHHGSQPSKSFEAVPRPFRPSGAHGLLEPESAGFDEVLSRCYRGFVHQRRYVVGGDEAQLCASLERLKREGLFHHDVVTNGGIRLGRTMVRRVLVGEEGITYKYLGLRTFAHPWSGSAAHPELAPVLALNTALTAECERLIASGSCAGCGRTGRSDFNLSLINLLEPSDDRGGALRDKVGSRLGSGEVAVSWHADSSLEDFSSIAVVNLLPGAAAAPPGAKRKDKARKPKGGGRPPSEWRIAMKCVGEGHEPSSNALGTPPLAVPLGGGDAYYMLGEFNHHHHHAVLAGEAARISSTHRVAVTATDTWGYIWARVEAALAVAMPAPYDDGGVLRCDDLRLISEVHSELETEWLLPWAAQGKAHASSHSRYWGPKQQALEDAWLRLEARAACMLGFLHAAGAAAGAAGAQAAGALPDGVRCFDVLEQQLIKRHGVATPTKQSGRRGWRERAASSAFAALPAEYRPFEWPRYRPGAPAGVVEPSLDGRGLKLLGEDLGPTIEALRRARAAFVRASASVKKKTED